MNKNKFKNLLEVFLYGGSHLLVATTSIIVVSSILGFNIPMAFLFSGIGTLIFHLVTKGKLPMVLGTSGLYIGGLLYATQNYGIEYAMGGIVVAGLIYIMFSAIAFKWQEDILSLFPNWLLSTVVLLIGLNLLPIGAQLISTNIFVGLIAFSTTALIDMRNNKTLTMFSMPLGVLAGTVTMLLTKGIDTSLVEATRLSFIFPKFAFQPIMAIAPLALAVAFETLGDTKNSSDIIGIDIFKEVGLGRIFLGNGLATVVGGMFGANAYTTYSENNAFTMLSEYYNPRAQLVTATLMIGVAFLTPLTKTISLIPIEALGGVVLYLFSMIATNAIKQMLSSKVNVSNNKKVFTITVIMLAISFMSFNINSVSISSVAIATLIGMLLNIMISYAVVKRPVNKVE